MSGDEIGAGSMDISHYASEIATALILAGKSQILVKIGIDDIRAAVVGYLAAKSYVTPTKPDVERLIDTVLRKILEKC
jgi:hypothetical protein